MHLLVMLTLMLYEKRNDARSDGEIYYSYAVSAIVTFQWNTKLHYSSNFIWYFWVLIFYRREVENDGAVAGFRSQLKRFLGFLLLPWYLIVRYILQPIIRIVKGVKTNHTNRTYRISLISFWCTTTESTLFRVTWNSMHILGLSCLHDLNHALTLSVLYCSWKKNPDSKSIA